MSDHITHIELAVIALLLAPAAAEKIKTQWRPVKNWLERRKIHRESQQ